MATSTYTPPIITPAEQLGSKGFRDFFNATFNFKDNSIYPYNKRIFVTFCEPISASSGVYDPPGTSGSEFIAPLRTTLTGSYLEGGSGFRTNNLAELSTAEAMSFDSTQGRLVMSSVGKFNQQYVAQRKAGQADHNHEVGPVKFISGSTMISICNDDNPSLLVELNKSRELPGGTGNKEFVVIPENLHPFIKDNLEYFLTRGGINVSGDTSPFIKLNEANRNLF